jgi:phosphoribosylaminoimidazolecarboxamide formyltransferase/IMP cyclohydrolase
MLDGRVKTLHPRIHAGILADRRKPEHETQLADQGIEPFDLVIVNLYPFRETVASGAAEGDVIEKIDIGGPAMVRAAAKNFASVGVVVSPSRYAGVVEAIRADGGLSLEQRRDLAAEAFAHTAAYDAAVAGWFASDDAAMPTFVGLAFEKVADLRYGENPHQHGALYRGAGAPGVLGGADVLVEGKEMSFNNWLDVDAALTLAADLERLGPAAVIVKHNNPCGAAVQGSPAASYAAAFESDTVSAFGGIVAFGREADEDAARAMADVFTEVVVAPSFTTGRSGRSRNARGCAWSEPRCPNPVASTCGCCTGARSSRTPTRHPRAGPSWRSSRSGSPPRTNGATCGSRGSSRCA